MEQGLAELRKIFIKHVEKVIEETKNTNEIESSLKSVCVHIYLGIICSQFEMVHTVINVCCVG